MQNSTLVSVCPLTNKEWNLAGIAKNCTTGVYHCLKDQDGFLVDVCAPEKLIRAGYCPYWSVKGSIVENVCGRDPTCPREPFSSDNVYNYPACIGERNGSMAFAIVFIILSVLVLIVFIIAICRELRKGKEPKYELEDIEEVLFEDEENANVSRTKDPLLEVNQDMKVQGAVDDK